MSRPKKPAHDKLHDAIEAVGARMRLDAIEDVAETAVPGWKPKPGRRQRFLVIVEEERARQAADDAKRGVVRARKLSEKAVWDRIQRPNVEKAPAAKPEPAAASLALDLALRPPSRRRKPK